MKICYLPAISCFRFSFLLMSAMGCTRLLADETTFIGPEDLDAEYFGAPWSLISNWSNGVPGPGDDVLIAERFDENNFPAGTLKANLDVNATIANLTTESFTLLRAYDHNLFVSGNSSINGELNVVEAEVRVGNFAQFDRDTKSLLSGPNIIMDVLNDPLTAILEFEDADIVSNFTYLQLFGPDASVIIRDQNTGLSAFRNFAHNHSFLSLNNGYFLRSTGNFTNHEDGQIAVNYRNVGTFYQPPAGVQIAGNLVNDGTIELYSQSSLSVSGGVSGSGSIKVLGLPCNLNVLADFELDGGDFKLGGTGIDSFILKAQNLAVTNGSSITGNGTLEASVNISSGTLSPGNSAGAIEVQGELILGAGSILEMEIGGTAHDLVTQVGGTSGVTLGGELALSTIGNFDDQVLATSTYTILDGSVVLSGAFSNVLSGSRLSTTDGKGSFCVDYGATAAQPDKVILSDYIAVNAPQTFAQWIATQQVNAPDDGPNADPNHDGITNLEAYFRGIAAKGSATIQGIESQAIGGNLIITLRSPRSVSGVTATCSISQDLEVWTDGPLPVPATTPTRNIYQLTIPITSNPSFVRFKIVED